jgi:hypothetical protein
LSDIFDDFYSVESIAIRRIYYGTNYRDAITPLPFFEFCLLGGGGRGGKGESEPAMIEHVFLHDNH